ncbi:MAG TPA: LuxR C-terminal-related transcriptional regulator [Streptosporangiaceae bacterium]|nr:LuxR C-terminal-related transcriptional regulator [Streptosporangiaceae bacterium]
MSSARTRHDAGTAQPAARGSSPDRTPAEVPGLPDALPVPLSSFVGRETEITALAPLLASARLVTLAGPGGAGKSRLAMEAVRRMVAGTGDIRVVFAAMDTISDEALVAGRVATALGIRDEPGVPAVDAIVRALASQRALLVLDAAEHVRTGVAELAARVLAEVPTAKIVTTSRWVLGIPGEQVWPVPVLTCPAPGASVSEIADSDAVRLFAVRAAERLPGFEVTPEIAGRVAELCRQLEGLPLAIELAAGWVGTLSVGELLDHKFDLIGGAQAVGDRRARTLRSVAESSSAMLGEQEQTLLRQLSVFAGWFTLADAAAVAEGCPQPPAVPLRRLVDSSWLATRLDGDRTAYRMLDTLREYAADQLGAAGGTAAAKARHARHFAGLARTSEGALAGARRAEWVTVMQRATADLDATLEWAQSSDVAAGLEMSAALWRWWLTTGRIAQGRHWLASFLSRAEAAAGPQAPPSTPLARAWCAAALLAAESGDYRVALEQASRALRASRLLGDVQQASAAATVLGSAHRYLGEHTEARRHLEQALAYRRQVGEETGIVAALNNLGLAAIDERDYGQAARLFEEALSVKRKLHADPRSLALGLANLGDVLVKTDQRARAATVLAEAAEVAADLSDVQLHGTIACNQGDLATAKSDFAAAAGHYQRALECFRAGGNVHDIVLALCGLGVATHRLGQPGRAARLLHEAETLVTGSGNSQRLPEVRAAFAAVSGSTPAAAPPDALTARQAEILGLLAAGLSNKAIAQKLHLQVSTVERHLATIYRNLGFTNRAQATRYAIQQGLLPGPAHEPVGSE